MSPHYLSNLLKRLTFKPVPGENNIFFVETSCAFKKFPNPASYDSESNQGTLFMIFNTVQRYVPTNNKTTTSAETKNQFGIGASSLRTIFEIYGIRLEEKVQKQRKYLLFRNERSNKCVTQLIRSWAKSTLEYHLTRVSTRPKGRSLEDQRNFGCPENRNYVSVGAINFAFDTTGRRFAKACIEEMRDFHPTLWVHNGAGAITRAVKKVCAINQINEITKEKCGGFHLLATSTFYSIPWMSWQLLFKEEGAKETMKMIGNNLAVHVWNAKSHDATVYTSSMQPYAQIARRVCPKEG
ncbi:Uncharacterized protein GBIM_02309 [Gryllus bimaculatus]|nr:Uncharacterized protein GBIM_02309 [Gryllus bimaculatus]